MDEKSGGTDSAAPAHSFSDEERDRRAKGEFVMWWGGLREPQQWHDKYPNQPDDPFDLDAIDFTPILDAADGIADLLRRCCAEKGDEYTGSTAGTIAHQLLVNAADEAESLSRLLDKAHLLAPEFEVDAPDAVAPDAPLRLSGLEASGSVPRSKRMRLRTARPAMFVKDAILFALVILRLSNQGRYAETFGGTAKVAGDYSTRLAGAISALRRWLPAIVSTAGTSEPATGKGGVSPVDTARPAEVIDTARLPKRSNRRTEWGEGPAKWITVTQAAKISGIAKGAISRAVDRKELKGTGRGRKRRICPADLSRWQLEKAERPPVNENAAKIRDKLRRLPD